MNNADLNKLAGQIRGLEEVVISLVCALEMKGSIDGPVLTQYLNDLADRCRPATNADHLIEQAVYGQELIRRIVDQLDEARVNRQSKRR